MADYTGEAETKPKYLLAAGSAYLGSYAIGAALGYSSPVSDTFDKIPGFDGELFGSILTIGALFGGLAASWPCERFGRKMTILLTAALFAVGWVFMLVGGTPWVIYTSRFILGFAIGIDCMALPVYIGEVATAERRGICGAGHQFSCVLGILVTYAFGAAFGPQGLAITCMVPVVLNAVAIVLMPETPVWLVKKKKQHSEVMKALYFLYGRTVYAEAQREILQEAQMNDIEDFSLSDLFHPSVRRPLLIALALMLAQQGSGINAVIFYTKNIFKSAGTTMDPAVQTIIVGAVQVAFTAPGTLLMDKLGRRILLLISSTVLFTGVSMLIAFYAITNANPDDAELKASLGWMPIAALSIYIAGFACGLGPVPWLMMGELLPTRARGIGTGICTAFNWLCAFMVTEFFPSLSEKILGYHWAYSIFAAITIFGIIFTLLCVPETKGKSLEEIEAMFRPTGEFSMDSVDTVESTNNSSFKIQ